MVSSSTNQQISLHFIRQVQHLWNQHELRGESMQKGSRRTHQKKSNASFEVDSVVALDVVWAHLANSQSPLHPPLPGAPPGRYLWCVGYRERSPVTIESLRGGLCMAWRVQVLANCAPQPPHPPHQMSSTLGFPIGFSTGLGPIPSAGWCAES